MLFCILKGHILHCKRASFTHQKGIFCNVKGRLLLTYLLTFWHPHSYKSEKQRLLSKSKRITTDYL